MKKVGNTASKIGTDEGRASGREKKIENTAFV